MWSFIGYTTHKKRSKYPPQTSPSYPQIRPKYLPQISPDYPQVSLNIPQNRVQTKNIQENNKKLNDFLRQM